MSENREEELPEASEEERVPLVSQNLQMLDINDPNYTPIDRNIDEVSMGFRDIDTDARRRGYWPSTYRGYWQTGRFRPNEWQRHLPVQQTTPDSPVRKPDSPPTTPALPPRRTPSPPTKPDSPDITMGGMISPILSPTRRPTSPDYPMGGPISPILSPTRRPTSPDYPMGGPISPILSPTRRPTSPDYPMGGPISPILSPERRPNSPDFDMGEPISPIRRQNSPDVPMEGHVSPVGKPDFSVEELEKKLKKVKEATPGSPDSYHSGNGSPTRSRPGSPARSRAGSSGSSTGFEELFNFDDPSEYLRQLSATRAEQSLPTTYDIIKEYQNSGTILTLPEITSERTYDHLLTMKGIVEGLLRRDEYEMEFLRARGLVWNDSLEAALEVISAELNQRIRAYNREDIVYKPTSDSRPKRRGSDDSEDSEVRTAQKLKSTTQTREGRTSTRRRRRSSSANPDRDGSKRLLTSPTRKPLSPSHSIPGSKRSSPSRAGTRRRRPSSSSSESPERAQPKRKPISPTQRPLSPTSGATPTSKVRSGGRVLTRVPTLHEIIGEYQRNGRIISFSNPSNEASYERTVQIRTQINRLLSGDQQELESLESVGLVWNDSLVSFLEMMLAQVEERIRAYKGKGKMPFKPSGGTTKRRPDDDQEDMDEGRGRAGIY